MGAVTGFAVRPAMPTVPRAQSATRWAALQRNVHVLTRVLALSPAEMAFNGSAASSDRWVYPNLWCACPPRALRRNGVRSARSALKLPPLRHTFTITLPPYEDTVQFIMVDTETLTSEQNQFPGWGNLPNLYYPPPVGQSTDVPLEHAVAALQQQQQQQGQPPQPPQPKQPPQPQVPLAPAPLGVVPRVTVAPVATTATVAPLTTAAVAPRVVAAATAAKPPPPSVAAAGRRRLQDQGGSERVGPRRGGQRRLNDFVPAGQGAPISNAQWEWFQHLLLNSSATWIVVIGNDPIWSAGEHGPTWTLAEKMLPMMEAAGVALYISGRDPIAQHITPSPSGAAVDFVGIGNGAYSNASQATDMPNELLCPDGAVAWTYGSSTGFLMVEIANPTSSTPAALTATFYDDTGTVLYSFTKSNPRAYKGFSVAATNMRRTLGIMGLLFLVVAACLCSVAGSQSKKSFTSQQRPGPGVRYAAGPAARPRGVSETTPLVMRPSNVGGL